MRVSVKRVWLLQLFNCIKVAKKALNAKLKAYSGVFMLLRPRACLPSTSNCMPLVWMDIERSDKLQGAGSAFKSLASPGLATLGFTFLEPLCFVVFRSKP